MKKVFRVSKQGLTRCPRCARHIFLEENWRETQCHFCDARLLAVGLQGPTPAKPVLGRSRSNLIAAGLLSASIGMAACDDSGEPDADAGAMIEMGVLDAAPDLAVNVALYGEPPVGGIMPEVDAAPEPEPQPEYGAPPVPEPPVMDAGVDAMIDAAPEPEPQPEYGAPPEVDAEVEPAPDPEPQPEYGAPPQPEEE